LTEENSREFVENANHQFYQGRVQTEQGFLSKIKVKTGVISAAFIFIKLLGTPREDILLSKETN
jgi:hypothetical protein